MPRSSLSRGNPAVVTAVVPYTLLSRARPGQDQDRVLPKLSPGPGEERSECVSCSEHHILVDRQLHDKHRANAANGKHRAPQLHRPSRLLQDQLRPESPEVWVMEGSSYRLRSHKDPPGNDLIYPLF